MTAFTKVTCRILFIACAWPSLSAADTVTLWNNKSYNGTVVRLASNALHLDGSFEGTVKSLDIPMASISIVEFNDLVDNSGPAPAFGAHDGTPKLPDDAKQRPVAPSESQTDLVVLLGGQKVKCSVTSIDKNSVRCADSDYQRDEVYRIQFRKR